MNTYVYHQGDPPKNVYVVVSGNFEIIRTTINQQKSIADIPRNLLGGQRSLNTAGGKISLRKKAKNSDIRIAIIQKGQIFGHDDVVNDRCYTTSVKCVSNNCQLYVISAHEFYHKLKKDDTCWKNLTSLVSDNDKYT